MSSKVTVPSRRRPVAAGIAMMFVLASPAGLASTWIVDNSCVDDINVGDTEAKTGTLRFCVKNAESGDTIDLSQTTCSQITLTTGAISILQPALTLHGAGKNQTIVSGKDGDSVELDRVFYADAPGGGDVTFDHLSVAFGLLNRSSGNANGGCIYGNGSITLDNVGVYNCSATTQAASASMALGGGVYAHQLTIKNGSTIANNAAFATNPSIQAQGGGAAAVGDFYLSDSVVALNTAAVPAGSNEAFGGGLELRGNSVITRALIANNHSSFDGGGIDLFTTSPTPTAVITNSTISMNGADGRTGGIDTNFASTTIANSTIVYNTAVNYFYGPPLHFYSPGVAVNYRFSVGAPTLTLQSTIIADNTSIGIENDLSAGVSPAKITIAGANNLVRAFGSDVVLPAGQGNLSGVCPLLGPLRDNGGGTFTHALHSGSSGVGAGNNVVDDPLTQVAALYDQRGPGYARVVNDLVDIGAYQRQADNLFDAAFDGCP
jgi:hypothetical protein